MKKNKRLLLNVFLCITLLLSTALISVGAALSTNSKTSNSITIHYKSKWENPNIYYWNSLPENVEVKWPGEGMTDDGDGWYSYTVDNVNKINFLFNDGSNQTSEITRKSGEWWYKNNRWTNYDPEKDKPVVNPPEGQDEDWDFRDETIYFVLTTRFYDGYYDNNVHSWDENSLTEDSDPAWRGDFQGLIDKLDYIKALGFSAIWVTPVVENASGLDYHGYHAMNFQKVDERYESPGATYQDLIDAIHEKDMKIIQDVVFNHTGNFGEATLAPMFEKEGDQNTIEGMKIAKNSILPDDYGTYVDKNGNVDTGKEYAVRLALLKDTMDPISSEQRNDPYSLYHHYGFFNWDLYNCQLGQIAGDCVDLNTENPLVAKYLVDSYKQYIDMGVDSFRVDTVKHISRLTFNNYLNDEFKEAGGEKFYMFGEVCTKSAEVWYRGTVPPLSSPFYTWKESEEYPWEYYEEGKTEQLYENFRNTPTTLKYSDFTGNKSYEEYIAEREKEEAAANLPHVTNLKSAEDHYNDNMDISKQPISTNHLLQGNEYHKPDYSMKAGLDVIDFQMHWNFTTAEKAFNVAKGNYNPKASDAENAKNAADHVYNDATWNVVYVDSHDFAPDGNPFGARYNQGTEAWAENLSLMFTFRGIPCIYYGSEIEFKKGAWIDKGADQTLAESGRAYFGDHLEGTVKATDFSEYTATGPVADTLNYPLAKHIQRLNKIRREIPALRKGQYSVEGVEGKLAYKRRYTKGETDSFVCVSVSYEAEFEGIPNGTYTDAISGDVVKVTDGKLSIPETGKGNLRVYVLDLGGENKIDGKIGEDGDYLN